jgi:hypothetical protein
MKRVAHSRIISGVVFMRRLRAAKVTRPLFSAGNSFTSGLGWLGR